MNIDHRVKQLCRLSRVILTALMLVVTTASIEARAEPRADRVQSISFRFQPVKFGEKNAFHVDVKFRVTEAITQIIVPSKWGSVSDLTKQTQNLKTLTPGTTLEAGADSGERELHARPGERVELTYDIVPLQTEWFRHPQEHMAIINADYFLFNPQNALVYPDLPRTNMVEATFDWRALPKGMPLVTSFGIGERMLRVSEPWYRILDALFAGGNFRITEHHENGMTLALAIRGIWKFSDAEAFAHIQRVVDGENKFWHAQPMKFFLVTLAPFDDKSGDNDGSGFTNAFMLFLSHEDEFDPMRVRLLAHEMFHHWNPGMMGPTAADEAAQWFTEGFTTYYEAVIPLRAGMISYSDYLEYLNRRLRDYETSPLRRLSNAEWQKISHSSGPGYELSYTRGAAIALWADAAIRERSTDKYSLDNVMFDLVNEAQGPKTPEITDDRIFATFARYLGPKQADQLRSMTLEGTDIPLPQKLGNCARLEDVMQTVVYPGFDVDSLQSNRIEGVDPDGPAYRAGIRDGQQVFRVSIYHDDPSKDVLLGVIIDGQRKMIQYSPAKMQEVALYKTSIEKPETQTCTPF
jgi:predicted metalloprotease with PDZ domain